ncbi:hypothetical protein [Sedimentitalea sp.]|uniref:hypothetical protein n=1 Tax=Sedimentitalea sp. TaxID=2048915 RepID=UPI003296F854
MNRFHRWQHPRSWIETSMSNDRTIAAGMVGAADPCNAPVQIQVAFAVKQKRGQFAHWMTQALRFVPKVAYLGRNRRQSAGLRNLQDTRLLGRTQRALPRLLGFLLVLVLGATECTAQSCRADYGNNSSGLNDRTTNRVVRLLKQGLRECQTLNSVYRYDCYRQNYRAAGRQLAGKPAYAPAQQPCAMWNPHSQLYWTPMPTRQQGQFAAGARAIQPFQSARFPVPRRLLLPRLMGPLPSYSDQPIQTASILLASPVSWIPTRYSFVRPKPLRQSLQFSASERRKLKEYYCYVT